MSSLRVRFTEHLRCLVAVILPKLPAVLPVSHFFVTQEDGSSHGRVERAVQSVFLTAKTSTDSRRRLEMRRIDSGSLALGRLIVAFWLYDDLSGGASRRRLNRSRSAEIVDQVFRCALCTSAMHKLKRPRTRRSSARRAERGSGGIRSGLSVGSDQTADSGRSTIAASRRRSRRVEHPVERKVALAGYWAEGQICSRESPRRSPSSRTRKPIPPCRSSDTNVPQRVADGRQFPHPGGRQTSVSQPSPVGGGENPISDLPPAIDPLPFPTRATPDQPGSSAG